MIQPLSIFQCLAEKGESKAQAAAGQFYRDGLGSVRQDYTEAFRWYLKAAQQGNADSQHTLAVMYSKGLGVRQDKTESVKRYRLAADQGHTVSQYSLAVDLMDGVGTKQTYQRGGRLIVVIVARRWNNVAKPEVSNVQKKQIVIQQLDALYKQIQDAYGNEWVKDRYFVTPVLASASSSDVIAYFRWKDSEFQLQLRGRNLDKSGCNRRHIRTEGGRRTHRSRECWGWRAVPWVIAAGEKP
jgi:Sel1 repeat